MAWQSPSFDFRSHDWELLAVTSRIWIQDEGKLSNPRGRAAGARCMNFFPKIYEIPRAFAARAWSTSVFTPKHLYGMKLQSSKIPEVLGWFFFYDEFTLIFFVQSGMYVQNLNSNLKSSQNIDSCFFLCYSFKTWYYINRDMCADIRDHYLPLENSCSDLIFGIIKNKMYFYEPRSTY
jgi:hypothetical protein